MIAIKDGIITHKIIPVANTNRYSLSAFEEDLFYNCFIKIIDETFKPDIILYYGGHILEMLMTEEARNRSIPVASYLLNCNYQDSRWCRDVDIILTDSNATAKFYESKQRFVPVSIGANIDPNIICAQTHERRHILFVNPSPQKGVVITICCALLLERKRPDIVFEVVESRGNWKEILKATTKALGNERESLSNVILTPCTDDMRPIYSRARITFVPSLGWESFGRVAAESIMNGIPAVVSKVGGLPETIGDGGIAVEFPEALHKQPFTTLPNPQLFKPITDIFERFYDDDLFYLSYVQKAQNSAQRHDTKFVTDRFIDAVKPYILRGLEKRNKNLQRTFYNKQMEI